MNQPFITHHFTDRQTGEILGGSAYSAGVTVCWNNESQEVMSQPNGAYEETLLRIVIDRLEFYQRTRYAKPENERALIKLGEALQAVEAARETHS